jgi:hypothetical protein
VPKSSRVPEGSLAVKSARADLPVANGFAHQFRCRRAGLELRSLYRAQQEGEENRDDQEGQGEEDEKKPPTRSLIVDSA